MTPRQTHANRAFTIMELLVVISIIVILASMILGGIAIARKMALKAKTSALIGNIDSGIVKYHDVNGFYPLDGVAASSATIGALRYELSRINAVPESAPGGSSFLDPFGEELHYKHFLIYSGEAPRPDTYRLWSCGPNQINESETSDQAKTSCDDIRNW